MEDCVCLPTVFKFCLFEKLCKDNQKVSGDWTRKRTGNRVKTERSAPDCGGKLGRWWPCGRHAFSGLKCAVMFVAVRFLWHFMYIWNGYKSATLGSSKCDRPLYIPVIKIYEEFEFIVSVVGCWQVVHGSRENFTSKEGQKHKNETSPLFLPKKETVSPTLIAWMKL